MIGEGDKERICKSEKQRRNKGGREGMMEGEP